MARGRFLDESGSEAEVTARRHGAFKVIPRVTHGSWVVKQAVGQNTPVLLGRKITTKYFRCAAPGPRELGACAGLGNARSAGVPDRAFWHMKGDMNVGTTPVYKGQGDRDLHGR